MAAMIDIIELNVYHFVHPKEEKHDFIPILLFFARSIQTYNLLKYKTM